MSGLLRHTLLASALFLSCLLNFSATEESSPQFLPNSLEVEVPIRAHSSKSVHYAAHCDKVWLEFVVTSCDYEAGWSVHVGFYSNPNTAATTDASNSDSGAETPSRNHRNEYRKPMATLIDQLHRKIVQIGAEDTREGVYMLTLSGFLKDTTVRIFTSESNHSNYREAFYPTSNISSEPWYKLQGQVKLKNLWLSWPRVPEEYGGFGDHLTCLAIVTRTAFQRCNSCAYSSMIDKAKYGAQCAQPVFRRCANTYNYESHVPRELRYVTDELVGVVSKLHPVTDLVTPFFMEPISQLDYKEVANIYMLAYVSLRPKEEIKIDMGEIRREQWKKTFIIVQPCYTPVRLKIDHEATVIRAEQIVAFEISPHANIRLKNSHKTITTMRYFFTDELIDHNPLTFTSKTRAAIDPSQTKCNSLVITLIGSQPKTQYCAIALKMSPTDTLKDYETPQCMNPRRTQSGSRAPGDPIRWESCEITEDVTYHQIVEKGSVEIKLGGLDPATNLAIEVFAKPTNSFYPLSLWVKVGEIFHGHTPSC